MTVEQLKNAIAYTAFHLLILLVFGIVLVGIVFLCEVLDVHKFIENVFIPWIAWLLIIFFLFTLVRCIASLIWYFISNKKVKEINSQKDIKGQPFFTAEEKAELAKLKKEIASDLTRSSAGVDPMVLVDLVKIGLLYAKAGNRAFATWSKAVMADMPAEAEKYLKRVYAAMSKQHPEWKLENVVVEPENSAEKPQPREASKTNGQNLTPSERWKTMRKILFYCCLAVIAAMCIFPPWKETRLNYNKIKVDVPAGYSPIWFPPNYYWAKDDGVFTQVQEKPIYILKAASEAYSIDYGRLAIQMIPVILLAAMLKVRISVISGLQTKIEDK